jgi:hypothetical protein
MERLISKEYFCKVIRDIEKSIRFNEELNSFLNKFNVDGFVMLPDSSGSAIDLLDTIFKTDLVSWFCWELDFGKDWVEGVLIDKNGKDIKVSTPEELYDFLTGE